ncbi:MAG: hypothetical protein QF926_14560 [Alphaproteobacteria bacterium]|nr:hypothetical protein [Alphaproteobacteria bacterium]MDP6517824.1 hypothetical protein [Alphaproteobacteria bacterium]
MALDIATFSNAGGGKSLFKALGHPGAVSAVHRLIETLAAAGPVAVYDQGEAFTTLAALHDLSSVDIAGIYVQQVERIGATVVGHQARPVTAIGESGAATVFLAAFDSARPIDHLRPLLAPGTAIATLDEARLPDALLTNPRHYLDPLNFATNFAFFRDADGRHTRLVSANYWHGYGGREVALWLRLFDSQGAELATWRQALPDGVCGFAIDSAEVRARLNLGPFTGQLFVHVVNAAGHDVVKYALDTYGDDPAELSCTHDANAWPSDLYAGLPAPDDGERVTIWLQNSHPIPIPAGAIGLNLMGDGDVRWLDRSIPAFGSMPLDVATLLPGAAWPSQIELRAGKHMVRPRYEIDHSSGRGRIAHVNVERTDLVPDPGLGDLANLLGKGYILPAPILPLETYETVALPTPMSTAQDELPVALLAVDASGRQVLAKPLGRLARRHQVAIAIDEALAEAGVGPEAGYGHLELVYDFSNGGEGDGWLHGAFRYRHRASGHVAETSFGAHMFNLPVTYRGEPQSYAGPPPGLSTRLFLRLGPPPLETLCHLIYPASLPWHETSTTALILHDGTGKPVAQSEIRVPCSGSVSWRAGEVFDPGARAAAGVHGYVLIRDTTCRLFGYHGLLGDQGAFSLDHMFGF